MKRRIFRDIFLLSAAVLLLSAVLTVFIVYKNFSSQTKDMLEEEMYSVAGCVDEMGEDFLLMYQSDHRITLVAEDGSILFDNENEAESLDNHNLREEIEQARKEGVGYSERYSDTVSEKTINVAVLLDNNMVLRVSQTRSTFISVLMDTLIPVCIVLVVAIILCLVISRRMSNAITGPINEMDLTSPKKGKVYAELEPLSNRIEAQNKLIGEQMSSMSAEHEKQDQMRREFTANVSHELKTPLTSISGFAEIIENGVAKSDDTKRFAGKIREESQRLIVLVEDIINLSKLEEKGSNDNFEAVDLYGICENVISQLEPFAKKMEVVITLSGTKPVITGVEQIVEEMVFNLVDNAIKYNVPGGKVTVSVNRKDGRAYLVVEDTGIGIPKEDLGRVFERFYRVDKSHSKEIGGTGLGLSIVKHGAIFLDADVDLSSTKGVGTKVTVTF